MATVSHKGRCFKVKELKKSPLHTASCTVPNTDGTEWPRQYSILKRSDRDMMGWEWRLCIRECWHADRVVLFLRSATAGDLNCKEENAAGLQWPATHMSYKERDHGKLGKQWAQTDPPGSWGRSGLMLFQNSECWWKSRCATQMLHCRHQASEHLSAECRLTVSNHTVVRQSASSACSVCKVKAKAEVAYW